MKITIITKSSGQTQKLGEAIATKLNPGDIVALTGQLGTGKTTLTQGLAKGLGVVTPYVQSPSFVLIHEYQGRIPVYHIDLYRLNSGEVENLGYEEYLYGEGVCIIEWAERMSHLLPSEVLLINLDFLSDNNARKILIKGKGKYEKIVKAL